MKQTLPAGITVVEHDPEFGGLASVRASTDAVEVVVLPHGAHLCHWKPSGQAPVLWMSAESAFADDQPVRGGVPICFPWFGPGRSGDLTPGHGWARLVDWTLEEAQVGDDGAVELSFVLDAAAVQGRPGADALGDFTAQYRVRAGAELELALTVTAGSSGFDFEEALHTYLAVADIGSTSVEGLDEVSYLDKVSGEQRVQGGAIEFSGETDRVYDSPGPVVLRADRVIEVTSEGATQTVVWNPWVAKSAAMPDFGDQEWPGMVCIEAANALDRAVQLQPGESHTLVARYRLVE